jgi:hypothetical protein
MGAGLQDENTARFAELRDAMNTTVDTAEKQLVRHLSGRKVGKTRTRPLGPAVSRETGQLPVLFETLRHRE